MIYRQPGGITFPPTLLPPSRGIACIVSCGGMERTSEAETKRERRERKSSIYFRGKKEEEKAKERKIFFPFRENLCSFLAPVYGIYVCKFEKRRKKKWNDKFRFRSNDHPNELSSAIITASITV